MSITAIVANGTITLPVHVPDGTRVQVTLPSADEARDDGFKKMVLLILADGAALREAGRNAKP